MEFNLDLHSEKQKKTDKILRIKVGFEFNKI
jgi:hypothetical protein